mmetsp:Transcript_23092/g.75158  ORF Transcript_23092/g.75158 Transcript_23092/m.75158 type:complete len:237 (-) Transcript_23092:1903-2613(-)
MTRMVIRDQDIVGSSESLHDPSQESISVELQGRQGVSVRVKRGDGEQVSRGRHRVHGVKHLHGRDPSPVGRLDRDDPPDVSRIVHLNVIRVRARWRDSFVEAEEIPGVDDGVPGALKVILDAGKRIEALGSYEPLEESEQALGHRLAVGERPEDQDVGAAVVDRRPVGDGLVDESVHHGLHVGQAEAIVLDPSVLSDQPVDHVSKLKEVKKAIAVGVCLVVQVLQLLICGAETDLL